MAAATRETATQRHWTCGRRLRERRHTLGLTQAEVVARIGGPADISNRSISTWENGRGLDFGWLPELAAALDCTVTYLLDMTDNPHSWQPDGDATRPASPDAEPSALPAAPRTRGGWILGPGPVPAEPAGPTWSSRRDTS